MDCVECMENEGEKTEVRYTTGKSESLHLCDSCRDEFREGEFVESVTSS